MMHKRKAAKALQRRFKRYVKCAARVRRHHDETSIHDFRIASRNLLALDALIPHQAWPRERKKVKRWLKMLNHLRDLQVLRKRFISGDPALIAMLDDEIAFELARWKKKSRRMARKKFRKAMRRLARHTAVQVLHAPDDFEVLLQHRWQVCRRRMLARLGEVDVKQPESLHRLRVSYKTFRYLALFLYRLGRLPELDRKQLQGWQNQLGEIQDLDVARRWLRQHRPGETKAAEEQENHMQKLCREFVEQRGEFSAFVGEVFAQFEC